MSTITTIKASDLIEIAKSNRESKGSAQVYAPKGFNFLDARWYKLDWARLTDSGRVQVYVVLDGGLGDSFIVSPDSTLHVA